MPSITATVTGKINGGVTVTAKVIPNLKQVALNADRNELITTDQQGNVVQYDITGATTLTGTAASGSFTLVIS